MKAKLIVLIAFVTTLTSSAVLGGAPATGSVEEAEIPGIVNFSHVQQAFGVGSPQMGFGGATEPSAMPLLKEMGYVTVINLRLPDEEDVAIEASRMAAEESGLNYISLPFDPKNMVPGDVDRVMAAVGDTANQPVYLHCASATRVAALWMIRRVLIDGWDIDKAGKEAEVIAKKPPEAIAFATAYIESHKN